MPFGAAAKLLKPGEKGASDTFKLATPPPATGKTDLLLRFFDSQFFDEWIAITYVLF